MSYFISQKLETFRNHPWASDNVSNIAYFVYNTLCTCAFAYKSSLFPFLNFFNDIL
jgi:hypothetical protein